MRAAAVAGDKATSAKYAQDLAKLTKP